MIFRCTDKQPYFSNTLSRGGTTEAGVVVEFTGDDGKQSISVRLSALEAGTFVIGALYVLAPAVA